MILAEADSWINFLREYGPISRSGNMYAEEVGIYAKKAGLKELSFVNPVEHRIREVLDPARGIFSNIILTGTAGTGKTRLCYGLWEKFGGDAGLLKSIPVASSTTVRSPDGTTITIHFIFDLSKWLPESGNAWQQHHHDFFNRFAQSIIAPVNEFFVLAVNDGKLFDACGYLSKGAEPVARLAADLEELLATRGRGESVPNLLFLDLCTVKGAEILELAREAILSRPEWRVFEENADDVAYGPNSPLLRNFKLLADEQFFSRLRDLVELCDASGFHFPIRDILLLLVNGLLGHPKSKTRVMTAAEIRQFSSSQLAPLAAIHRNVFGDNLTPQRRRDSNVFNYLRLFRVGLETSNQVDNLLLFGPEIQALERDYADFVRPDPTRELPNGLFDKLRQAYLEEDHLDERTKSDFMAELANERRRIFFRIPEDKEEDFGLWDLTVFHSAGKYRTQLLRPIRNGTAVAPAVVEALVRGLNRVWTGMLTDESGYLFLTRGLDYTTARISRILKHKVPVHSNAYGEKIEIVGDRTGLPVLEVHVFGKKTVRYPLNLLRFEFLMRVANGSLPNSFSRECYEDVVSFKAKLLAVAEEVMSGPVRKIDFLRADDLGSPREEYLTF